MWTIVLGQSSSEVKRESETTTEVAVQKIVESQNEVQKIVKAREYARSTSSKAIMFTMWARRGPTRPYARNPRLQKSTKCETTFNSTLQIERAVTSTSTRP